MECYKLNATTTDVEVQIYHRSLTPNIEEDDDDWDDDDDDDD